MVTDARLNTKTWIEAYIDKSNITKSGLSDSITFQNNLYGTGDCIVYETGEGHPSWDAMLTEAYGMCGYETLYYYGTGMWFPNVTIPQGAEIGLAKLQFYATTTNEDLVNSIITGEAADNSQNFTDIANYNARPRTSESVTWDNVAPWIKDRWHDSVAITPIIQEIVDRDGWTSGNALTLFWEESEDSVGFRRFFSYEYGPTLAPKLVISYQVPVEADTTIMYADPEYPLIREFHAATNPVDGLILIGEPNSTPELGHDQTEVMYMEHVPIFLAAINKTGVVATKLKWDMEAEIRRICREHPEGSRRGFERRGPADQEFGGEKIYITEFVLSYQRRTT